MHEKTKTEGSELLHRTWSSWDGTAVPVPCDSRSLLFPQPHCICMGHSKRALHMSIICSCIRPKRTERAELCDEEDIWMKSKRKESHARDAAGSTRMLVIASHSEKLEETRKGSFPRANSESVAANILISDHWPPELWEDTFLWFYTTQFLIISMATLEINREFNQNSPN